MDSQKSRENILKKIRKALQQSVPLPFPEADGELHAFPAPKDDLAVIFGEQFTKLTGRFIYCPDEAEGMRSIVELIRQREWKEVYSVEENLKSIFEKNGFNSFSEKSIAESDASITTCETLVARTGSMVLSAALTEGRTASVYSPVHICIAYTSQLVFDIKDAIRFLQKKYGNDLPSLISFATGPSRTADIEKTLVVGVHGPKEVFCILIEDLQ
ncbi:LutC/YkgG family protein [Pollutibacter soli]|uniref:LutC/YkgG family protein n=1 Tax=Pollutibacter soli TaxID=3034157 RepID=UPI0030133A43